MIKEVGRSQHLAAAGGAAASTLGQKFGYRRQRWQGAVATGTLCTRLEVQSRILGRAGWWNCMWEGQALLLPFPPPSLYHHLVGQGGGGEQALEDWIG